MRLSASDLDWKKLSPRARWALENVTPLEADGMKLPAIAAQLGEPVDAIKTARDLLEAEVQALAGKIVLPELTEDEFEALKLSIETHGQRYPILRGSDGIVVDGRHRQRACRELGIEPWYLDLDRTSDQLQSLALAVNVSRRHLTAGARRGIARAELLRNAGRSDRAIASVAGLDGKTVAKVRAELETTAEIPQFTERAGADGKVRPATREPDPPPTHRIIRVRVAEAEVDQLLGRWVTCTSFRLHETKPNLYELQVQLLDSPDAHDDLRAQVEGEAGALDRLLEQESGTALQQLLGDATDVFGHEISTTAHLKQHEAEWCFKRLGELAEMVMPEPVP